ncbi:MAG TPA: M48 family metalloprotease [Phycisphaerales bacterium]|nr:M48 family metalloprotease [Phycisphaerales bacterium]
MPQAVLIAIVVVIVLRDGFSPFPLWPNHSDLSILLAATLPFVALAALVHLLMKALGRQLDRTGAYSAVAAADLVMAVARIAVFVLHAAAVLGFGWLDVIRTHLGDLILLDEAAAASIPVLTLIAFHASFYEIENRIAQAGVIRALDAGEPVHPIRTRTQYVADQIRHQMAIVLVPVTILGAWAEGTDRLAQWLLDSGRVDSTAPWAWAFTALHFGGVFVLLLVMPLVLRRVWSTVRLGAGPLRDHLQRLCDVQGVRCRELLVWRTHGSMINGALVGLIAPARYILLTDALLERLPLEQVEAVMAHEAAHARRRHLPWLIVTLAATGGIIWTAVTLVSSLLLPFIPASAVENVGELIGAGALAASLAIGYLVFGVVSRKFEEQADAFAVQHLSGWSANRPREHVAVRPEAVEGMSSALLSVARLNHIPLTKFSWRHGSIASRRARLHALMGRDAANLPIDRTIRRLKLVSFLALLTLAALWILVPLLFSSILEMG